MNLYNVLSINGIDIDEYLEGGGSEEINEIKQNTFNLNSVVNDLNNYNYPSNVRYINFEQWNNYMINNYSKSANPIMNEIGNEFISFNDYMTAYTDSIWYVNNLNSIIDKITKCYNLNSNVDKIICSNTYLQNIFIYTYNYTISTSFLPKTLYIFWNLFLPLNGQFYSYVNKPFDTYINECEIYYSNIILNTYYNNLINFKCSNLNLNVGNISLTAGFIAGNTITNFNCNLSFIIINTVFYMNTITNLNINFHSFKISVLCSECKINNITIKYINYYDYIINTLFVDCTIDNIYLYLDHDIYITSFENNLTIINKIYCKNNVDTSKYVDSYKIPTSLTSKITTF